MMKIRVYNASGELDIESINTRPKRQLHTGNKSSSDL